MMIKVSLIAVVGVLFANFFRNLKQEYSILLGLAISILFFFLVIQKISGLMNLLNELWSYIHGKIEFIDILVKMLGISYICELAAGICKDAGYQSIATQVVILGKITMISMGTQIIVALIRVINMDLGM